MNLEKYFELYLVDESSAETFRQTTIPNQLIKFVALGDNFDENKKRFTSLEKESIWLSNITKLNDPFEFKGFVIDEPKLKEAGYSKELIEAAKGIFNREDFGVASFSANGIDYLPMWAYYTNNYRGFCVEYSVIKKDCIHEVIYELKRVKVGNLIIRCFRLAKQAIKEKAGKSSNLGFILTILMHNFYMKSNTWAHEKEYRIVQEIDNSNGVNIPTCHLGLRTNKIIAGVNCSVENVKKLNEISNSLGLGNVYISKLSSNNYGLEIERYVSD